MLSCTWKLITSLPFFEGWNGMSKSLFIDLLFLPIGVDWSWSTPKSLSVLLGSRGAPGLCLVMPFSRLRVSWSPTRAHDRSSSKSSSRREDDVTEDLQIWLK